VLAAGTDPAAADAVAARLMGFEIDRLPIVKQAFASHRCPIAVQPLEEIRVEDERTGAVVSVPEVAPAVPGGFRPHFGWPGLNPSRG
jgi:uncharacterized protein (DUF362 family)